MADDLLGLTADPLDAQKIPDYLGQESPLAFKGQPALPVTGAAAFGAPSGPLTQGGGGSTALSGGAAGSGPGGSVDFASLARALFQGGGDAAKLLGGTGDLGTRGDTGGVSLADVVRSGPFDQPANQVSGGELSLGQEAGQTAGSALGEQGAEQGLGMLDNSLSLLENFGGTAGLGLLSAELLPIIESFFGEGILMSGGGSRIPAQIAETKGIRENFQEAFPVLKGATGTESRFANLGGLSKDEQIKELQGIAQEGGQQLSSIPATSEFTSTQGGRQSGGANSFHIDPVNVSGIEAQTPGLYMDAYLNTLLANDKLAALGVPFPSDTTGTTYRNPLAEVGPSGVLFQLAQEAGVDPNVFIAQQSTSNEATGAELSGTPQVNLTPEEIAGFSQPGQLVPTIQSIFTRLNPEFGSSPLGQRLAALGGAAPAEAGSGAAEAAAANPAELVSQAMAGGSFGDVAGAAMSEGGGGEEQAAEQLGVAA